MTHPISHRSVSVILASSLVALSALARADDLIFADILNPNDPLGNSIRRVHVDGTGLETLISTGGGVRGIDVDVAAGYIYWSDTDNFVIRRARFDGSGQEDLVTSGLAFPSALRLSVPAGRIFWGDQSSEEMYRSFFDGSDPLLMATTPFYRGLAVDEVNSMIYWTTSSSTTTGRILRSDFVGNGQQIIVGNPSPISKPGSLAIDVAGGKIYWTDQIAGFVLRANLDGSSVEPIHNSSALGPPKGIVLDAAAGKVYFGQDIDSEGFQYGQIYKMNLDGSFVQLVADNLGSVNDLILVRTQSCYANCDDSTSPPILNANDFQCFLNNFAAGLPSANCDNSTAPPVLNANDFQCFLNAFASGCP